MMRNRFIGAIAMAALMSVAQAQAPQGKQAPQAKQTQQAKQGKQAPQAQGGQRPATIGGHPNFNGVWQALNGAYWNLEAHSAQPLDDFWGLGAIAAVPA